MTTQPVPPPRAGLGRRAFRATLKLPIGLALMIFLPAWTLTYANGWYVLANLSAWSVALTWYLFKYDPDLLERRLAGPGAETEPEQKRIQRFAGICVIAIFVISALDYRFGWSAVSLGAILAGHALVCLGMLVVFLVFRENSFAASTIRIADGQRVISTGPYSWVRHPMYSGALLLFIGVPLALGSWWGLAVVVPLLAVLVLRLRNEELFLLRHLPGYAAYRQKLPYRLVPGIW
jgi:protein-S-isoprenylcysteine O-methyltransferase Ste14